MKINELKTILKHRKLDFALFYNLSPEIVNPNFFYFSNYKGLGALIVPKKKAPFIVAPKMEYEKARDSDIKKAYQMDKKKFFESIKQTLNKQNIKKNAVAIDNGNFTLKLYKNLKKNFKKIKTKDISLDLLKLRQIKTNKEILFLKKSCNYASKILKKTINDFKDFKTEAEAAAFLEYETKKLGLELSFPPIVASGSNGSMPHHEPKSAKIKSGLCVIDFGVKYKGYCSDITRTICVGKPNNKEKIAYDFILKVQKSIIKNIRLNGNCGKIYENCVKDLKSYSKYFIHGLGHGVGVEIHELPNLTVNSKDKIEKNVVFTVEPGIYIPNKFGIRIEDTILMKNDPIILTKVDKDLTII